MKIFASSSFLLNREDLYLCLVLEFSTSPFFSLSRVNLSLTQLLWIDDHGHGHGHGADRHDEDEEQGHHGQRHLLPHIYDRLFVDSPKNA
jgi:hypothetical protein